MNEEQAAQAEAIRAGVVHDELTYLKRISDDMSALRKSMTRIIHYMEDAESEVPEKMRRFIMYFHDMHDLRDLYHTIGLEPPEYIMREIERCSDRFRHLLEELHAAGGTFEKVRQDMSTRGGNRYDHNALLCFNKEHHHEAGNGEQNEPAQGELPGL